MSSARKLITSVSLTLVLVRAGELKLGFIPCLGRGARGSAMEQVSGYEAPAAKNPPASRFMTCLLEGRGLALVAEELRGTHAAVWRGRDLSRR